MAFLIAYIMVAMVAMVTNAENEIKLRVLHTNDIHARYNQRGPSSGGKCDKEDNKKCYGGMARHYTYVNGVRRNNSNEAVLFLSGGDWFSGTIYFTKFAGKMMAYYLDALGYDAMGLGNHEFDRGPNVLLNALKMINETKILSANIDVSGKPGFNGVLKKYTIKEVKAVNETKIKVGIIGYTIESTSYLSSPGPDIVFEDEVESVAKAAIELTKQGVKVIIALGHAGYDLDLKLCEEVPELDLVVGGHTNTFLYNDIGDIADNDDIEEKLAGDYPTLRRDGKCGVVQAYAYGKWMGNVLVTLNSEGVVTSFSGNPVLMDETIVEDAGQLEKLAEFDKEVEEFRTEVVGTTARDIDGRRTSCRYRECEMGNIVADMYRTSFPNTPCSLLGGGSVRSNLDAGNITFENLMTILPFTNKVDRFKIQGKYLREAFEHSVSTFDATNNNVEGAGRYLQVSGFKVIYNNANPVGSRVEDLQIENEQGKLEKLKDDKVYTCTTNNYMLAGGDNYMMLRNYTHRDLGREDVEVFKAFVEKNTPLDKYLGIKDLPQRSFFSSSQGLVASLSLIITVAVAAL